MRLVIEGGMPKQRSPKVRRQCLCVCMEEKGEAQSSFSSSALHHRQHSRTSAVWLLLLLL